MSKTMIKGVGKALPEKILTNADLEKMVETNHEWIVSRTGIEERRIAAPDETTSILGARAGRMALEKAGVKPEEIDCVICATMTPDMMFPATACLIQKELGLTNAAAFDIEAACSGFVYGLSIAHATVASGLYKNVLLVCAETMSRILDWNDRNTCILFGDGAGAVVVGESEGKSDILGFKLRGDGSYGDLLYMKAGGSKCPATAETVSAREHFLRMNGNAVFKVAVREMTNALAAVFAERGIDPAGIDLLVPHQANIRIVEGIAERLNFPMEKIFINLNRYGNTSAATIPIALCEAEESGRLKRGDKVAIVSMGAGFTWGAGLLIW